MTDSLRVWWKLPEPSDRLTMLVIVGTRSAVHSLRSQVGMVSYHLTCYLRVITRESVLYIFSGHRHCGSDFHIERKHSSRQFQKVRE